MKTILLSDFQIAETKTFEKVKKQIDTKLYTKIKSIVYPQLRSNPFYGNNIKKLKGEFEGYYRYRVGNYKVSNQGQTTILKNTFRLSTPLLIT